MSNNNSSALARIAEAARASFTETHGAREQALRLSREIVRNSANSIRATHRGEFDQATELLADVARLSGEIDAVLAGHPGVYYAGYVEDALKEYAEASATLSFAEGRPLAGPEALGVGAAPYLNGLSEAVGELRRFILDSLRRDDVGRCEDLLGVMDEIYTVLVSMDFPDAVTKGLRRRTDMARGILERTRGDLTVALRQRRLEGKLADLQASLDWYRPDTP
jgi:translin